MRMLFTLSVHRKFVNCHEVRMCHKKRIFIHSPDQTSLIHLSEPLYEMHRLSHKEEEEQETSVTCVH